MLFEQASHERSGRLSNNLVGLEAATSMRVFEVASWTTDAFFCRRHDLPRRPPALNRSIHVAQYCQLVRLTSSALAVLETRAIRDPHRPGLVMDLETTGCVSTRAYAAGTHAWGRGAPTHFEAL